MRLGTSEYNGRRNIKGNKETTSRHLKIDRMYDICQCDTGEMPGKQLRMLIASIKESQ